MISATRSATVVEAPLGSEQNKAKSSQAAETFSQELANLLEGYLSQSSGSSHFEIAIDAKAGQDPGTRQFVVTVKDPASAPVPAAPASSANPMQGVMMYSGTVQYVPDAAPVEAPVYTDEVDAYWGSQPEEVQELRAIQDPEQRAAKASELTDRGFAIDSEIMVWGHDPYMTMKIRQDLGYTWIPSIGQPNIPVAPGLSFPGLPSYDPKSPPAGSIPVSLDFAVGLEHTSPWWRNPTASDS